MNLRRLGLVSVVVALATTAGLLFSASASHLPVADPDDTRGLLDISRVEVEGTNRPKWKVITFPRWSTAEIFDYGYALVLIDTFNGQRPDYYILVGSLGSRLYADLFRDRESKKDVHVSALSLLGRADDRSFYVRLPLKKMKVGEQRTFFRWRIETLFTGDRCHNVCFDKAPDTGLVSEPLPLPTTSPSPSVTPTPSPTD